jgi:hypothetical protein
MLDLTPVIQTLNKCDKICDFEINEKHRYRWGFNWHYPSHFRKVDVNTEPVPQNCGITPI